MKKVLGLFFGFMLCTSAYSKVAHDYIIELCDDDEDLCVILSAQGESIGFIATQEVVNDVKAEGIDLNMIVVCEDFYLQAADALDRHEINSFFDEGDDDFLEVAGGKGKALRKLKDIYDQWERGGSGGGGEGGGGGSAGSGKKTCGKCHTDGKHSHHPPTGK